MNPQTENFWAANKLTIKGIVVGILILVMLIPSAFIASLVKERGERQEEIIREVSSKWASSQNITGPVLVVPYLEKRETRDGAINVVQKVAYILPDLLKINGEIFPETKYRSIYNITVYGSDLNIEGNFSSIASHNLNIPEEDLLLNEAKLCMGITDFKGIEDQVIMQWNESQVVFNSGLPDNDIIKNGLSAGLPTQDVKATHAFKLKLRLKGSEKLSFTPIGKTTQVSLASAWADPTFDGNFLPFEKNVDQSGFTANWKVQHLNRNYPQSWKEGRYNIAESAFWVGLLQPVDSYSKTMRSVKYAILFIALTFGLYFFVEILQKKAVHPIQYILVGMALSIFYTLLLSISEYIRFNAAYAIASSATILLITLYTKSLFSTWKVSLLFGGLLTMLYGFIFILIQLQDNALLFGSIGLFILLAIIMYYSRKIEWYGKPQAKPALQ
ncbi:MAG: cell envelope integrity protein CreD [Chitinophagaceae bacterium]|nr:cell envelope integrity protein CreD [Chitinophagaceae bacterium]MCW5928790.1 cell envelope integrity protein CreD [Chitinophagaceae bacterium]